MTRSNDDWDRKIDDLLRTWASEQVMDPDYEPQLVRSIMSVVDRPLGHPAEIRPADIRISASHIPSGRRPGNWVAPLSSAAAIFMLVAVFNFGGPLKTSPPEVMQSALATSAGLSDLWSRTSELFGPQLNWLCDLDGELILGVDSEPHIRPASNQAFVLLTIRQGDVTASHWKSVWTGRIVCGLGDAIDFESRSRQAHADGTIWIQSRPDGRLAASHWLNWSTFPEVSGAIEADVAPGERRVIAQQVVDGRTIQLVQQICLSPAG